MILRIQQVKNSTLKGKTKGNNASKKRKTGVLTVKRGLTKEEKVHLMNEKKQQKEVCV